MGGVLEHPEASHAWQAFNLATPPRGGGWIQADAQGGWTCRVEQGFYGHRSLKPTWLYTVGIDLPELRWGMGKQRLIEREGLSYEQMRRKGVVHYMSKRERAATPPEFRDLLIAMAKTVNRPRPSFEGAAP